MVNRNEASFKKPIINKLKKSFVNPCNHASKLISKIFSSRKKTSNKPKRGINEPVAALIFSIILLPDRFHIVCLTF